MLPYNDFQNYNKQKKKNPNLLMIWKQLFHTYLKVLLGKKSILCKNFHYFALRCVCSSRRSIRIKWQLFLSSLIFLWLTLQSIFKEPSIGAIGSW